ncbi:MAG: hypothetical protein P8Z30_09355 [Acidobacteriota bacterium]
MNEVEPSICNPSRLWILTVLLAAFLAACSTSTKKQVASPYQQAKDMFKQGNLDRALSLTGPLASADSNDPDALNARVLRAVIYSGQVDAWKELADTYKKGSQKAKNPRFIASYNRHRSDALQYGNDSVLNLGEVVMQFTSTPNFPKEFTLDAPWPSVEGPENIPALKKITQGGWVSEDDQTNVALDVQRRGVDDALAELVGGNRTKARAAMQAGPVKLNGLDFALFLEKEVMEGITFFGPKYINNPDQVKTLCGVADRLVPPIEAMLKANPDKKKEAEFKKLQKQVKDAEKNT